MSIYVEITIHDSMDNLWRLTQTPELHQRWDVRFSTITYLERADTSAPQRFRYATRLGFGKEIEGWGETVGERTNDRIRTSALTFGSEHWQSLIHNGSGYWKYEQIHDHIRFITGYDYQVRWGIAGRIVDRFIFRPMIGWATAWSFDRLRLWVERGITPEQSARQAIIHALATGAVAIVWMWHGLVPKLAGPHPDELAMLYETGLPEQWVHTTIMILGIAELVVALAVLLFSTRRWPWLLTIILMIIAPLSVIIYSPERIVAAFGPITLSLAVATLSIIGLLSLQNLPSARRCLRRPSQDHRENH